MAGLAGYREVTGSLNSLASQVGQERIPGTLEVVETQCGRLIELRANLQQVNMALHGPRPQDANTANKAPLPANLRTFLDQLSVLVDECHAEVKEIYESLGIK